MTSEDISVQTLGNLIVIVGPVFYLCMGMSAKVSSLSVIVRMPVCERVHMSGKNVRLRWLLHKGLFSP